MSDKKAKLERAVSPRLVLSYPYLNSPDTHFNKKGEYKTKAVGMLDDAAVKALIAKIDEVHAAWEKSPEVKKYLVAIKAKDDLMNKKTKGATRVFPQMNLPYTENQEEGTVTFGFKMNASYERDGKTLPLTPKLFDAKKQPLRAGVKIGGGTVARISFEFLPYCADKTGYGISLRLTGVQVIELKEFGGQSAESLGFEEEDGFVDDGTVADTADKADTDGTSGSQDDAGGGLDDDSVNTDEVPF